MRRVTQNIYNHHTPVQRPSVDMGKVKPESANSGSSSSEKKAPKSEGPTKAEPAKSGPIPADQKRSKSPAPPPKPEPAKTKTADNKPSKASEPAKPEPAKTKTADNKLSKASEPAKTFPTPSSRPVIRDSSSSWPKTPREGASRNSRNGMSNSRPTTQGGSRLTVFSREPTIMEDSEEERRHLYSALSHAVNSKAGNMRLKSRGSDRGDHMLPVGCLSAMSEEERSRRAMECSYCETLFREPKIFCCTRLCQNCLQSHINISEMDSDVTCPVCRKTVPIPDRTQPKDTWSEQFRTDTFLLRLLEVTLQLKKDHDCHVCESSKNKKTAATAYCFDCDTCFCDHCNDMHLQLRGLTTHSTAILSELHPRDIMSRRRVFCNRHTDRYIERYCRQCNALMCQTCADEAHKKCTVVPTQLIGAEKRSRLETLKEDFDMSIKKAEEEDNMLRNRGSRMQNRISQRKEDIESAFKRIETALAERKKKLLDELDDDSLQDGRGNENRLSHLQALVGSLKDNGAISEEMVSCASDRDLIESSDDMVKQCVTLSEVTKSVTRLDYERPNSMARVDKYSVNTFLTLLTALGEDINDQVVAFRTRQVGLRMAEDKENPSIKDIQLMEKNILLAVDNGNMCLKGIAPREGGGHKYLRLDFKTRPWGITRMQTNVVCVSGHQCLYVVTVSDQALTLQSGVRTRKDYWSVASLSPINVAAAYKFPPSIDIVDITNSRLRTIEGEQNGVRIFKQPTFIAAMNDNIIITDSGERSLSSREDGFFPRGVCTDEEGRAYLVDGNSVVMVSPEGKQLCRVLTCLPDPRAISVGKDNLLAVSMDGRGVTFFTLSELKGPYN
ncbi:hypothetical protein ACOMHN_025076 [Nucella lapillus]